MSVDATRWAWKQECGRATSKLVLLSLADRANEQHVCYPSIQRLETDTGCDRKTIMGALRHLESAGLITAHRQLGKGSIYTLNGVDDRSQPVPKTGQVPVPKLVPVPNPVPVPETALGPVPKTVLGSAKNGTGTSTKNGTQNLPIEPNKNRPREPNNKNALPRAPSWLPAQAWSDFVDHRQRLRKPLTPRAAELVLEKLGDFNARGIDAVAAINTAIERGWQTVFEPRPETTSAPFGNRAAAQAAARTQHNFEAFQQAMRDIHESDA